jgi:hypothetical protein
MHVEIVIKKGDVAGDISKLMVIELGNPVFYLDVCMHVTIQGIHTCQMFTLIHSVSSSYHHVR